MIGSMERLFAVAAMILILTACGAGTVRPSPSTPLPPAEPAITATPTLQLADACPRVEGVRLSHLSGSTHSDRERRAFASEVEALLVQLPSRDRDTLTALASTARQGATASQGADALDADEAFSRAYGQLRAACKRVGAPLR